MTESLSGVMSRINQIRAAISGGAGGTLGVSNGTSDFQKLLRAAGGNDSGAKSSASSTSNASNADPLDRIAVDKATKTSTPRKTGAAGGLGSEAPGWPEGIPEDAEQYAEEFLAASQATGVPLRILLAVAWAESAFNPDAESVAGAQGMMQLMPATAAGLGVNPGDPAQNIMGGARYLAAQYEQFGSWDLAFAAYNAGPGAVEQYGGIPPYRETQNYVATINSYLEQISVPSTPAAGAAPAAGAGTGTGAEAAPVTTDATARPAIDNAVRQLGAFADVAATTAKPGDGDQPALQTAGLSTPVVDLEQLGELDRRRIGAIDGAGTAGTGADGAAAGGAGAANAAASAAADRNAAPLATPASAFPERLLALVQQTQQDGKSGHRLSIRLDPPELGVVDVSFELRGDQVHVIVRPERTEGGDVMSQQRERIAQALAREGLELSGFDISGGNNPRQNGRQAPLAARQYGVIDLEATTEVALTVDRELRL